jgi:hypothetical protein
LDFLHAVLLRISRRTVGTGSRLRSSTQKPSSLALGSVRWATILNATAFHIEQAAVTCGRAKKAVTERIAYLYRAFVRETTAVSVGRQIRASRPIETAEAFLWNLTVVAVNDAGLYESDYEGFLCYWRETRREVQRCKEDSDFNLEMTDTTLQNSALNVG